MLHAGDIDVALSWARVDLDAFAEGGYARGEDLDDFAFGLALRPRPAPGSRMMRQPVCSAGLGIDIDFLILQEVGMRIFGICAARRDLARRAALIPITLLGDSHPHRYWLSYLLPSRIGREIGSVDAAGGTVQASNLVVYKYTPHG